MAVAARSEFNRNQFDAYLNLGYVFVVSSTTLAAAHTSSIVVVGMLRGDEQTNISTRFGAKPKSKF